jgi:GntR family transcriptional regulator
MPTSVPSLRPGDVIHSELPVPKYYQIEQILLSYIESGEWKAGQQIPIEEELQTHFRVSRSVVRQAVHNLEVRGLLWRGPGKGTFVAARKNPSILIPNLLSFHEDAVIQGHQPSTSILAKTVAPCPEDVAHWLEVPVNSAVLFVRRRRFVDGTPLMVGNTWVRVDLVPDLVRYDLTDKSLYQAIEQMCKAEITHGRRILEATLVDGEDAALLDVQPGAPVTLLRGVGYLPDSTPVEYSVFKYRGDRACFEVELGRKHTQKGLKK